MAKDIPLIETRLEVANMTCGGCASRAEKALLTVPGVVEAHVNLATKQADIWTEGALDRQALASISEKSGYPATPLDLEMPKQDGADEVALLKRNFLIALVLTLPVFILEMGGHVFPAFHHWVMANIGSFPARLIQFVLTTAVLAGPGRVFFRHGLPALKRGAPEMNSLVVLGTTAAWAFSSVVTFAPAIIPENSRFVYFEAAAVIVTLILLGRYLEARARGQAGAAISKLMGLRPDTATRLEDGAEREVKVFQLRVGDLLRLRPGERVAVDGEVIEGGSYIDESMITGEPMPVAKEAGAVVTGGTVNGTGALVYRATAVGAGTVLAKIVKMVENAQATRLPIQSLINKVTAIFVPVVMTIAVAAAFGWWAFGPDLASALVIGVSVLIIACPCAMGLATPVSIMAGTGRAAELGVLFRKGDALQALRDVDLVVFDKTGTLTEGRPQVTRIEAEDETALLTLAASIEAQSEHPLGRAILVEAQQRDLVLEQVDAFESVTGQGAKGIIKGATVTVGSAVMLRAQGFDIEDGSGAETLIYVAKDDMLLGSIALADTIKHDAAQAVAMLTAMGKRVAMLSGDAAGPVQAVAKELGIATFEARMRPEDKLARVTAWRAEGLRVAFVGDGINDAPVLAAADVGVALGSGTDVAMEAADVVLVSGAPSAVANAIDISRATMANIAQNLFWAFGYNVALIPVAAGALALFGGPLLSPMLAAGAMAASSVLVVMNALRLRHVGLGA
ncbi:heavy metal translocating P-type ATPase [Rhodophyticola sp. SM2404]